MLDAAHFIVLNKFEKPRSEDALRDIRKQWRRNHNQFAGHPGAPEDHDLPVYGTMASQFNDVGVNALFFDIVKVPLRDDEGNNFRLSKFAGDFRKYLNNVGLTTSTTYNGNNIVISIKSK